MDYTELSALSARFGDQNRHSSIVKAYETITAIAGISTAIEKCNYDGSALSGARVLSSLKQTDGKIEYGTRELSVNDLAGKQYFDSTVTCAAGNVMTGFVVQNLSVISAGYSQIDNNFIKSGAEIDPAKISGLTSLLSSLSSGISSLSSELCGISSELCGISSLLSSGISGLSSNISSLRSDLRIISGEISTAISCKVFIQNPDTPELSSGKYNDCLSVIKLPISAYEEAVVGTKLCDDVLYLVDSDYVDMYGQEICALSTPGAVGTSNAANTLYVDQQISAGNAASATKLQAGRVFTIQDAAGVHSGEQSTPFDGTADLNIKLPSVISADVIGNLTGDVSGNLTGDVSGNLTGDVSGNLTGDVSGNVTGNLTGDVSGNLTGDVSGNVTGNLTGDVSGNVTGNLTGDVTGNVTGNLTGDVSGNLTGDVTGNADTASALLSCGITSYLGQSTTIAASQKLATDISTAVIPEINAALTQYTTYTVEGGEIQLKNMKLVKYEGIYEDSSKNFEFYVLQSVS